MSSRAERKTAMSWLLSALSDGWSGLLGFIWPAWMCLFSMLWFFSYCRPSGCPLCCHPATPSTLGMPAGRRGWEQGRMPTGLGTIPEPPGETRAQACTSRPPQPPHPRVIHFTWTGCPLVDSTCTTIYNPHFKAKVTEAWSASEMG